jgi:hypothetical protein
MNRACVARDPMRPCVRISTTESGAPTAAPDVVAGVRGGWLQARNDRRGQIT